MTNSTLETQLTLTVIYPCYREAKQLILEAHTRTVAVANRFGVSVTTIVAQNGDPRAYQFQDPAIGVEYDRERGFGRVLRRALKRADGEFVYISSPDHPFGLMDLEQMLLMRQECEVIVGSKLHPLSTYVIDWKRKLSTTVLSLMIGILVPGFEVRDPNGSLWLARKAIDVIKDDLKADDFFFSTEVLFRAFQAGLSLTSVPVTYVKLEQHSSVQLTSDGFDYAKQLLGLVFSHGIDA
jgi:hypothetical protein